MTIVYAKPPITLGAGRSVSIITWIGGNRVDGGEYRGPTAMVAVSERLRQRLVVSTVEVELTGRNNDGFTSRCLYHNTVTNENSFPVTFVQDWLFD